MGRIGDTGPHWGQSSAGYVEWETIFLAGAPLSYLVWTERQNQQHVSRNEVWAGIAL